jgi:hypothetical protein
MNSVIKRAFLRLGIPQKMTLSSGLCASIRQMPRLPLSTLQASFIELLPRIDLNTRPGGQKIGLLGEKEACEELEELSTGEGEDCLGETGAILKISTFKRKKPKVRKDRARTIRRRIKRKSAKKRAKYNL